MTYRPDAATSRPVAELAFAEDTRDVQGRRGNRNEARSRRSAQPVLAVAYG